MRGCRHGRPPRNRRGFTAIASSLKLATASPSRRFFRCCFIWRCCAASPSRLRPFPLRLRPSPKSRSLPWRLRARRRIAAQDCRPLGAAEGRLSGGNWPRRSRPRLRKPASPRRTPTAGFNRPKFSRARNSPIRAIARRSRRSKLWRLRLACNNYAILRRSCRSTGATPDARSTSSSPTRANRSSHRREPDRSRGRVSRRGRMAATRLRMRAIGQSARRRAPEIQDWRSDPGDPMGGSQLAQVASAAWRRLVRRAPIKA